MSEIIATVLENREIAENIFSLSFDCGREIPVRAGQFAMLSAAGFPLRRPIAVCSQKGACVTVCYRLKGAGTRALSDLKTGDRLPVLLPLGNGFFVKEEEKKIALVGGGVGIFPLLSVLEKYPEKEIYSYMGFRNGRALCKVTELKKSKALTLASDDGSFGYHGTAVAAFLEDFEKIRPDVVFSCGPEPMLKALKAGMAGRGVPLFVSLEERMGCGIGACLVCVCNLTDGARARVCKDGPVFAADEIEL